MKKYMNVIKLITVGHHGQTRVGTNTPFVIHPMSVFEILYDSGVRDENTLFASLLHDTLEDTDITKKQILEMTNEEVVHIVSLLTKEKNYDKEVYFKEISNNERAKLIKVADRIHNLESSVTTNLKFRKRYVKETEEYFLDLAKGTVLYDKLVYALTMVIDINISELVMKIN